MTTYNTGNPIGSTDPRDLYDNAENFDSAMHTPETTWTDRLGNARPSWAGATGYQVLAEYAAGINVTTYSQVIHDTTTGEYWRAAAGTALPYTTTGAGMPESGKFVSVGDAVLRGDLVAAGGSDIVGFQQSGAGSVVRTAQDKMREWVSVKDFGAVGDGVADDTVAFNNLKTYAASAKARVIVPSGTYILQPATDLAANDTEWHFDSGAILKLRNTQAATSFITFTSPVNQRVFGLRVDANRAAQHPVSFGEDNCAVLVVDANKCTFDGVEIISSPAKGFVLVSSPTAYTRDISVSNFKAANCVQQALLVDGNNLTGLFERIVISGVRIGATSHAGVAFNDGAHSIALSDVISDVQNSTHDAVSVRDSYDIQMNNIRGRRGRSGIMFERLHGFTGRVEMNNVIGEFNAQSGVLFFGAERITASGVIGRCNVVVGINIAATGGGFRSKQINIAAPSAYDDQFTPTQQYGVLVQGVDDAKIGKVIAFNNTLKNISIIRAVTSNIDAEIRTVASGSTGSIAASAQAVITLSWDTPFEDAAIDIEAVYVSVGTTGVSLAVAHVVAVTETVVQVMVFNRNDTTDQTGTLTVIGRRRV